MARTSDDKKNPPNRIRRIMGEVAAQSPWTVEQLPELCVSTANRS